MSGFLETVLEQRHNRVQVTNPRNPAYWAQKLFGGQSSATGLTINEDTAMKFSAVYAGIKMISEDVAGLPLPVYQRQGENGRVKLRSHPVYRMLNKMGNAEMTAFTVREILTGHMLLRGNGYAERQKGSIRGDDVALWPLRTDRMQIGRNGHNGLVIEGAPDDQLAYIYTLPDGGTKVFAPELIFNLRNFGPDGLHGYDLVTLACEAIALGLATEQYSAAFFGNGATPDTVLTMPMDKPRLSDDAFKRVQQSWKEAHQGLSNAHRIAILEEGLDVKTIGVAPEKAALIQSRKFQIIEFARWLRVPPTMLGELGDATFSNVEELGRQYAKFTLHGPATRWETQVDADFLAGSDDLYAEHLMDEFMRGSPKERAEFYQSMRQSGNMTANQVADKENQERSTDPIADQLLVPLNMAPASAFDANGMTLKDRCESAKALLDTGRFTPEAVVAALNLPADLAAGVVQETAP